MKVSATSAAPAVQPMYGSMPDHSPTESATAASTANHHGQAALKSRKIGAPNAIRSWRGVAAALSSVNSSSSIPSTNQSPPGTSARRTMCRHVVLRLLDFSARCCNSAACVSSSATTAFSASGSLGVHWAAKCRRDSVKWYNTTPHAPYSMSKAHATPKGAALPLARLTTASFPIGCAITSESTMTVVEHLNTNAHSFSGVLVASAYRAVKPKWTAPTPATMPTLTSSPPM